MRRPVVLIKGGGDLASGVAHHAAKAGIGVIITERAEPTMVRRKVSFGNAVYEREVEVEGVKAWRRASVKEAFIAVHSGAVAVLVDPTCSSLEFVRPAVLVDAIMAKKNTGTKIHDAPLVIAVGPGFEAGRDCHAVVESLRGENMGNVLYSGSAALPTGKPAEINGHSVDRVLRAPAAGVFRGLMDIGESVEAGATVARVGLRPNTAEPESAGAELGAREGAGSSDEGLSIEVKARIAGVLRGLLADGLAVGENQKIGDIDPTGNRENCFRISDKAQAVGAGVMDAIRKLAPAIPDNAWVTLPGPFQRPSE